MDRDDYSLLGSEEFYNNLTKHERWRLKHIFDYFHLDYRVDTNGNFYYKGNLEDINIKFERKIGEMKRSSKMDLESELSYKVNNRLDIFLFVNCTDNLQICVFRLKDKDWTEENKTRILNVARPILGDIDYRFGPLEPLQPEKPRR